MAKIVKSDKDGEIAVGEVVALLVGEGEDWKKAAAEAKIDSSRPAQPSVTVVAAAPPAPAPKSAAPPTAAAHHDWTTPAGLPVLPSVRSLLLRSGLGPEVLPRLSVSGPKVPSGARILQVPSINQQEDVVKFLKSPQSSTTPASTPAATSVAPAPKKTEKAAAPKAAPASVSTTHTLEPAAIERAKAYTLAKQTIPHSFAGSSIRFKKQPANLAQFITRSAFGALLQVLLLTYPQVPTLRQDGPILLQLQQGTTSTVLGLEDVERMAEPGFTGRAGPAAFLVVVEAQVVSMAEVVVPGQVWLSLTSSVAC